MTGPAPKSTTTLVVENIAENACREAIGFFRAGRPGRAEYALVRASLRIARIVDDHASVATLTELKLVEPFHDPRLGDVTSDGAA